MWEETAKALSKTRIILASGSPRRCDILKDLGMKVEVIPSLFDENLDRYEYKNCKEYVQALARCKVENVYNRLRRDLVAPFLIIGADTLVTIDDKIFGKPESEVEAFKMLSSLSNKEHIVYTGVYLKTSEDEISFCDSARVKFGNISSEHICSYIKTGEPLDKAGAYGIQGMAGCFVEEISGDFYTVVGLPLRSLIKRLNELFRYSTVH